jgi:lipopolysaccharide transport system permease protein
MLTNSADSRLQSLFPLLRQMAIEIWQARYLAWEVMRRNVSGQYRQSLLGLFLAFVPPLIVTIWCTLIRHARVIDVGTLDIAYPAFVLISMMLWLTFVEALNAPINGLVAELPALAKAIFPAEAIVIAHALEVLFHFGIKLILIVAAILWFQLPVSWTVIFAPLALVMLVLLGISLGMILAPINALYQDVSQSLAAVTTFWLFLTPVLFPVPKEGLASLIVKLNPVTPLLSTTRGLMTPIEPIHWPSFIIVSVLTLVLFLASAIFFRVALPVVIDRTNA